MEQVAAIVDRYATFPVVEKARLFELTLLAFLTGNEDIHLKNFSIVTRGSRRTLSPAYDLVNTTIALPEAREELALPLREKKSRLTREDLTGYFGRERLRLTPLAIETTLGRFSEAHPYWEELIAASFLSETAKRAYGDLVADRFARVSL